MESEVEVASASTATVQFGKGPSYRQGKRVSVKAAAAYAMIGIAAIIPIFLLSPPEKAEEVRERVSTPDGIDQGATEKSVAVESYSAGREQASRGKREKKKRESFVHYRGLESVSRPRAAHFPPGALVSAILESGASNGPVRAKLKEPLRVGGETLFSEGAILFGTGQTAEDRLFIHFTKVVFQRGDSEVIDAAAVDVDDKIAGLKGSKVGHYAMKLGSAIGLNFVSGLAEGLQQKESLGQQVVNRPSTRNALLNGASHASLDLANETMTDLKSRPPVIEVEAGKEILILFGSPE